MGPLHMIGLVFVVSDLSTPVQGAVIIFHIFTSYSPLIKRANSSAQNLLILNYTSKLLVCYANCCFEYIIHNASIQLKLIAQVTNNKMQF